MRKFLLAFFLLFSTALAADNFPALTGRVVDNANIISPQVKTQLEANLQAHEAQTTNQIVVVTVPNLNGQPIEDFGVKLGRHWGIGQKGKNNGVLFIIAPNDRATRIEVGYGLEGTLTDALSSQIIQTIVLPKFKDGNLEGGIVDGTTAIISILGGAELPKSTDKKFNDTLGTLFIVIFILLFISAIYFPLKYGDKIKSGGSDDDNFGGGSSGGGFSGGGGSFGGGGSSGRW